MSKKILLFCFAIFVSLLAVGSAYTVMRGMDFGENFIAVFALNFPVCLLIGYLDYLTILGINRQLTVKNEVLAITINVIVTSMICFAIISLLNVLISDLALPIILRNSLSSLPWNLIIVMMVEAMYYSRQKEKAAKERAMFHLAMLKQQLHPHFLFNCLNTLASLAYTDAKSTNLFAKNLSSVYRYLLDTQSISLVTVTREIAFVERYLQLEKIRFGNSLNVIIEHENPDGERKLIPTSIQLLVENAIKHNVCSEKSPLRIRIRVLSDHIEVTNTLNRRTSTHSTGLGLKNLSQQYRLHNKEIEYFIDSGNFTVRLPLI